MELIKDIDLISAEEAQACDFKTTPELSTGKAKKVYIESYGCQMNFSDSEIVASIMKENGYDTTSDVSTADVVFLNTCSIREKAEQTVRNRLVHFNGIKKYKPDMTIGVLGCMTAEEGLKAINTFLSREETYADISPVRLNSNGVSAFISIMRGCDNMCSFCVVPFTRGRERSRDPHSIVAEAKALVENGYKEVTLLGQNVDSYKWSPEENNKARLSKKENEVSKVINFAQLLEMVAQVSPSLRVRFSTSDPKDITDEVLHPIQAYDSICKYIHLPVQSGNSRILELMNRTYDRDWYLDRVKAIREIVGEDCGISSDMIAGFCTETEEEHQDTLSLMDKVQYDFSYMFYYSERPGTLAAKKYADDIPLEIKKRRLAEIIEKQTHLSLLRNRQDLGKTQVILIDGVSKKSEDELKGRNSANKVVVVPGKGLALGDYVRVKITDCTSGTLFGEVVEINPSLT